MLFLLFLLAVALVYCGAHFSRYREHPTVVKIAEALATTGILLLAALAVYGLTFLLLLLFRS